MKKFFAYYERIVISSFKKLKEHFTMCKCMVLFYSAHLHQSERLLRIRNGKDLYNVNGIDKKYRLDWGSNPRRSARNMLVGGPLFIVSYKFLYSKLFTPSRREELTITPTPLTTTDMKVYGRSLMGRISVLHLPSTWDFSKNSSEMNTNIVNSLPGYSSTTYYSSGRQSTSTSAGQGSMFDRPSIFKYHVRTRTVALGV